MTLRTIKGLFGVNSYMYISARQCADSADSLRAISGHLDTV